MQKNYTVNVYLCIAHELKKDQILHDLEVTSAHGKKMVYITLKLKSIF